MAAAKTASPEPSPEPSQSESGLSIPDWLTRLVGAQTIQLAAYENTLRNLPNPTPETD